MPDPKTVEKVIVTDRLDKVTKSVQAILAVLVTIFTFTLFYALLFKNVTGASKDVILFILGSVSTILTQIISYFFGSSKGADDKTQIIGDMAKKG